MRYTLYTYSSGASLGVTIMVVPLGARGGDR